MLDAIDEGRKRRRILGDAVGDTVIEPIDQRCVRAERLSRLTDSGNVVAEFQRVRAGDVGRDGASRPWPVDAVGSVGGPTIVHAARLFLDLNQRYGTWREVRIDVRAICVAVDVVEVNF